MYMTIPLPEALFKAIERFVDFTNEMALMESKKAWWENHIDWFLQFSV